MFLLASGPSAQKTQNPTASNQGIAKWIRADKTDPLRGTQFSEFTLDGKYLTAPRKVEPNAVPAMVVRCQSGTFNHKHAHGKFMEGFIFVGSVVDTHVSYNSSLLVSVQYRLDDGKLQSDSWRHSTDYSSLFFGGEKIIVDTGSTIFNNLLYGHLLPHKENTNPQVRKIVLGVPEYLGGEVVMQFDMPDATEVADTCGVLWHK